MKKIGRYFHFIVLCLSVSITASAQNCDCKREMQFVIDYTEHNSPSYFDQVNNTNRGAYVAYKKMRLKESSIAKTNKECVAVIARYFFYFIDKHLQIGYKENSEPVKSYNDPLVVQKAFENERKIAVDPVNLFGKSGNTLEGAWQSDDGHNLIGIVRDHTPTKDYDGIVMKQNLPYWAVGQVRFEFKQQPNGTLVCVAWNGSRLPKAYEATTQEDTLKIGNLYTYFRVHDTTHRFTPYQYYNNDKFQLKKLSAKTLYLGVPSFEGEHKVVLDSLISHNLDLINSTDNLIIDLRNNLGGNSDCFDTLMSIIYTNPIERVGVSELASYELIKFNEHYRDSVADNKEDKDDADSTIAKMNRNIGHFLPVEKSTFVSKSPYRKPAKIAVLQNKYTASTAEEFLYYCKQSKKVIRYGDNSCGYFNYGATRNISLPCLPYQLYFPTNKSGIHDNYEHSGIPPDVRLNVKDDVLWIDRVQKILEE